MAKPAPHISLNNRFHMRRRWNDRENSGLMAKSGLVGLCVAILISAGAVSVQSQAPTDAQLKRITLRVLDLDRRRQLHGATPATIDSLLALYSDSVVYEHTSVHAVLRGKSVLRK